MSRPSKTMAPLSASTTPPIGPQQRRLAGTVRADDGHDLALADFDRHVGEDRDAVVAHPQVAHGEEGQLAVAAVEQHLRPRAHGGPDVAHVVSDQTAGAGHDQPADGEDGHQYQEAVAEADGIADAADDREYQEPRQDEQRADGKADGPHSGRDGERQGRQDAGSDDGEGGDDAGVPDERDGDVRREREQDREAGGNDRGDGEHAEDEPDVPLGEAGRDRRTHRQAEKIEDLDRGGEVGALERIEVEGLLVLQRRQRGEAGDGGGEEGQGHEDAAQGADLPDRAPGLAQRRRRFGRGVGHRGRGRVAQGCGLSELGPQHLLGQLELLVPAAGRLPQAGTDQDDDDDRHGEDEERDTPREEGGEARADQDAGDDADAVPGAVGRIDARAGRHRVVVGQQGVVSGEDHGLPHVDADEHDGDQHDGVGQAHADGERGADEGADQGDAHPVHAVGEHGDGQRERKPGGAGDGDDEQDPRVGEVERVADVRGQHVEGALRGLVEQLDREEHAEGEERYATAELADVAEAAGTHGVTAGVTGVGVTAWRRSSASTAQSRRS